ncbi:hypothetical protein VTO73DRAFT_4550, partial [Trametes versicolor]
MSVLLLHYPCHTHPVLPSLRQHGHPRMYTYIPTDARLTRQPNSALVAIRSGAM